MERGRYGEGSVWRGVGIEKFHLLCIVPFHGLIYFGSCECFCNVCTNLFIFVCCHPTG